MEKQTNIFLGHGAFSWNPAERIADRYGTFFLFNYDKTDDPTPHLDSVIIESLNGSFGSLKAKIVSTRTSSHIGDIFRQIKPQTPQVGEEFLIGTGYLFSDRLQGEYCIGLRPKVARATDWLDPHVLYKCHHQTVDIFFCHEK